MLFEDELDSENVSDAMNVSVNHGGQSVLISPLDTFKEPNA